MTIEMDRLQVEYENLVAREEAQLAERNRRQEQINALAQNILVSALQNSQSPLPPGNKVACQVNSLETAAYLIMHRDGLIDIGNDGTPSLSPLGLHHAYLLSKRETT